MKKLYCWVMCLLLNGCATSYQSNGFAGGYSETQLSENVFNVTFNGNGYTGKERASDFSLLRSAEIAKENGFRYFIIVSSEKDVSHSTYTTPTTSYTNASAYGYGNYAYGSATTNTYGGQTYDIAKPSASNTIVCYKDKPDLPVIIYDAEFVYSSIRNKYHFNH